MSRVIKLKAALLIYVTQANLIEAPMTSPSQSHVGYYTCLQLYKNVTFTLFSQRRLVFLIIWRHVGTMRFVLTLGIFALLSSQAVATPWDVVPMANEASPRSASAMTVSKQRGGTATTLQTLPELELSVSAVGLGQISALALSEDGTLYSADKKSGRIWALSDRRQDGKIDLRRPMPFTFNQPTGLAVIGGTLFVADRTAVWTIERGEAPKELASLRSANSGGQPHILQAAHSGDHLLLGLTTNAQDFRILKLDLPSGQASLVSEGVGPLHSFAVHTGSDIWVGAQNALGPLGGEPLKLRQGQSIANIVLPGQYTPPADWPRRLKDHIIVSQIGPNAMQLLAIPTEFGQVSADPRVLLDGFMNRSQRSAWGAPDAMLMDARGLFVADADNGTLLRLSPKPKPEPKITIVDTASVLPQPSEEPTLSQQDSSLGIKSTIQGTQIDAKSTITQPSSIIYGSKLIRDYDAKKALEEAEKAENEPEKKKRRMSRKRQQKDD